MYTLAQRPRGDQPAPQLRTEAPARSRSAQSRDWSSIPHFQREALRRQHESTLGTEGLSPEQRRSDSRAVINGPASGPSSPAAAGPSQKPEQLTPKVPEKPVQAPAPAAAPDPKTAIRNAPSATALIPFDQSPLVAPGERIIFNATLTDPSPGDYELQYSTTGGHFNSDSGATAVTKAGLISGNVDFFVPKPWDGSSTVQVVLKVVKKADHSVARTDTWTFALKAHIPTTATQVETTGERALGSTYSYDIGPALRTGHKPFYQHQTILERFGEQKLANIAPADIAPAYRRAHSLDTADKVSAHFVTTGSGGNGTFTVDGGDQIFDMHAGHDDLSNLVTNLAAPKDIEVALPQTYEANPGTALANFTIKRILKADGTTWKLKKG